MSLMKITLASLIAEDELRIKEADIVYTLYWLRKAHCDMAKPIRQVDNKIGWKCKHVKKH